MALPLKLGAIEQQHLQEIYDSAGVPRDQLPYSVELAQVCRDFQDRTFKNASEAQVYGALLKYVRTSRASKAARPAPPAPPRDRLEQARLLRMHRPAGPKLEPYTPSFDYARDAFARNGGAALSPHEFWTVVRLAGTRAGAPKAARRPAHAHADGQRDQ